jgi:dTDP-4-amino-4,6-dideoxygalactose transaminase
VDVGSSYLPSEILAAFLLAQLEARERIQAKRHHIWRFYAGNLSEWARARGIQLPTVPPSCEHPAHLFYLLLPSLADRQALIAHLKDHGISSVFHYLPLHLSEMGQRYGGKKGDCPVTEDLSDRLLRLPFFNTLTDSDLARIVDAVRRW